MCIGLHHKRSRLSTFSNQNNFVYPQNARFLQRLSVVAHRKSASHNYLFGAPHLPPKSFCCSAFVPEPFRTGRISPSYCSVAGGGEASDLEISWIGSSHDAVTAIEWDNVRHAVSLGDWTCRYPMQHLHSAHFPRLHHGFVMGIRGISNWRSRLLLPFDSKGVLC